MQRKKLAHIFAENIQRKRKLLGMTQEDPGPVFFTQKRIGKDRNLFNMRKFRSMKMSTPHDTPTHLLAEPERYGANAVRPGLIGWAQVNGRDELEIPVKARLASGQGLSRDLQRPQGTGRRRGHRSHP